MRRSIVALVALVFFGCSAPARLRAQPDLSQSPGLHGTVIHFNIGERDVWHNWERSATIVEPRVGRSSFPTRWVWFIGGDFEAAGSENERYANALLDQGYVVAAFGLGIACGSPACVRIMEAFYQHVIATYGLDPQVRLLAQSNGGLAAYAFAAQHPDHVGRIGGIFPAVDWRSWPGVANLPTWSPDTAFTAEDLANQDAINPINTLAPLAAHGVVLFHLHGDSDAVVNLQANSFVVRDRYRALGGTVDVQVLPGVGHEVGYIYQLTMVRFLTGLTPYPPMERVAGPMMFARPGGGV